MRQIDYIVIHCTATSPTTPIESIERFWKQILGWKYPGYHYVIKSDGEVVQLRDIAYPANGVKGYNNNSIHIAYVGGKYGVDTRTEAQKQSLAELVEILQWVFLNAKVTGHRDLSPDLNSDGIISPNEWTKLCPSFDVKQWLKQAALIAVLVLLTSCGVFKPKPTVETFKTVTDSTSTKVTYETKKDTLRIPAESVKISIPVTDLTAEPVQKQSKSGRITATVSKVNDVVTVDCKAEEYMKIIETQNKTIETLIKVLEQQRTDTTTTEYKTPWYSKALNAIGLIAIAFVVFRLVSKSTIKI